MIYFHDTPTGFAWNRTHLLSAMNVYGTRAQDVEQAQVPPEALVAWMLQASTQAGIRFPNMVAASKAVQNPEGPGGLFSDLAALGPETLAAVMYWAQVGGPGHAPESIRQRAYEFRQAIGRRVLPDRLGLRRLYRSVAEAHEAWRANRTAFDGLYGSAANVASP